MSEFKKDIQSQIKNEEVEFKEGGYNDIITLINADGEEVDFIEVAEILYGESIYTILQPFELLDGMDVNDALVFKVIKNGDGSERYDVVHNDEIVEGVFEKYNALLDEYQAKNFH